MGPWCETMEAPMTDTKIEINFFLHKAFEGNHKKVLMITLILISGHTGAYLVWTQQPKLSNTST